MNSIEHLSWSLPLILVSGIFRPRFTLALTGVIFTGRTLYSVGYTSCEGANSKIREMGAIPLNIAELLLVLGLAGLFVKHKMSWMLTNRKFYKRWS